MQKQAQAPKTHCASVELEAVSLEVPISGAQHSFYAGTKVCLIFFSERWYKISQNLKLSGTCAIQHTI